GLVDWNQVGMIQARRRAGLTQKALTSVVIQKVLGARHLEGDIALKFGVVRQKDDAKRAAAQLADNLKTTQLARRTNRGRGRRAGRAKRTGSPRPGQLQQLQTGQITFQTL